MTDHRVAIERIELLNDAGRHEEAVRAVGPILAAAPDDVAALYELGRAQAGLEDTAAMLEVAGALTRADPDGFYAHVLASQALHTLKDHAGAVAAAQEAVRRAPERTMCHLTLAWAARTLPGGAVLARAAANQAVALAPDYAETHYCAGTVFMTTGDLDTGERALLEALRLDPEHSRAQNNLALVRSRQGRLVEAIKGLLAAAALDPRGSAVPHNLDRIVWRWLVRTHWGLFGAYLVIRGSVEDRDADGVGFVLQAPVMIAAAAALAIWWTRRTVLRLGPHARSVMWRLLHRSVFYALRFWCLVVAALASVVVGLGYTGQQREVATSVAIVAFGGAFLAAVADLIVSAVRQNLRSHPR